MRHQPLFSYPPSLIFLLLFVLKTFAMLDTYLPLWLLPEVPNRHLMGPHVRAGGTKLIPLLSSNPSPPLPLFHFVSFFTFSTFSLFFPPRTSSHVTAMGPSCFRPWRLLHPPAHPHPCSRPRLVSLSPCSEHHQMPPRTHDLFGRGWVGRDRRRGLITPLS